MCIEEEGESHRCRRRDHPPPTSIAAAPLTPAASRRRYSAGTLLRRAATPTGALHAVRIVLDGGGGTGVGAAQGGSWSPGRRGLGGDAVSTMEFGAARGDGYGRRKKKRALDVRFLHARW
jgi:hypothetical protein